VARAYRRFAGTVITGVEGGLRMQVIKAKTYIGYRCEIISSDRTGAEIRTEAEILDVIYIPLYGSCLITDCGEIMLDKVRLIRPLEVAAA